MPIESIVKAIGDSAGPVALILGGLSLFVEVSKIKINPITAILSWMGERINGNLTKTVEKLETKVDALDEKSDMNEIDRIRWEILDFANSCRNGHLHTKDEFTHIIALNQKYHDILDKRDMTNGQIDLEYAYIVKIYKHCQEKNSFL